MNRTGVGYFSGF